ncbi:MAG: tetratricopeptide repeat protein [bacterium]|nr:tetratricopeptide repeat protein [bacterium]
MISSRTPLTGPVQDDLIPEELEDELEVKVELIEHEDYPGLVAYLERIVDRRPGDAYAVKDLGEAYVMNEEPEKALELLEPLYREAPQFEAVQWVILDALFALGRDEGDFEWVEVPAVVRLDADALEACFEALTRERAVNDVEGLYCRLLGRGYCAFSEERLLEALRDDRRFLVEGSGSGASVRLRREGGGQ